MAIFRQYNIGKIRKLHWVDKGMVILGVSNSTDINAANLDGLGPGRPGQLQSLIKSEPVKGF